MPHTDDHDLGLAHDLSTLARQWPTRRAALRRLAAGPTLALLGCGGGSGDAGSATNSSGGSGTGTGTGSASCSVIPEETAGPYPGDGSNSSNGSIANALALSGVVRSDIRSSVGSASATAAGMPLTVVIELVNTNGSCADLSGYAIYLWHCDALGRYSMYSSGVTGENYLRGVQPTASNGTATFQSIFPGCYAGRMPHIHFEVYRSTGAASQYGNKLRTSQIALPRDTCSSVYSGSSAYSAAYSASVANLAAISFATDNVFSDGVTSQLATMTGDVTGGFTARLTVGIAA
jgi:protocatechuate 3,4-dioxygenase beta subunit